MTAKYYAILTTLGAAKLANAMALGTKLEITTMAVGDGGGVLPTPDASQTAIVGEKRRAPINMLNIDPANPGQIIAEQIIPENDGGFWIRTIGLYDKDGTLIAVANCPETYKPQLQEGSGRTQTIRMILIVSNTDAITLKIDPSVVLATRKYVDDRTIEVKAYADDQVAAHLAAANPHNQYAPKDSPALTGKPTAPTAAQASNDTQLATTAFVKAALAALVDSSPAALDTLNELAAALGDDPNFAATMATELSKKMDKARNGADIPDVAAFLANLGFGKRTFNATADFIRIPDIPGGLLIQWVYVPVPDGAVAQQIPFTWKTALPTVFLVGAFIGGDVTTRRCNAQVSGSAGGLINATNSGTTLGAAAYVLGIGQ